MHDEYAQREEEKKNNAPEVIKGKVSRAMLFIEFVLSL
jgi:hypothetical protein